MLPILYSSRISLHPAAPADLDVLHAIWTEPDVRRFLFDDAEISRERASELLSECQGLAGDGLGLWTIHMNDTGTIMGCAGLLPVTTAAGFEPRLAGLVEPLVALAPAFQGAGYAGETLSLLVAHAFDVLGLPELAAVVDVPNAASGRLAERTGFRNIGECDGPRYRMRTFLLDPAAFADRSAGTDITQPVPDNSQP